jgi:ABC-type ATPase with predicted acetyltransferase domain
MNIESEFLKVESVKSNGGHTSLRLQGNREVSLRPFIYVKPGDLLEFVPKLQHFNKVNKILTDKATGLRKHIKLHPPYSVSETVLVPPHQLRLTFRERLSSKDWRSAKLLEQFHYRGKGLNKIVGRRTVLIVESDKYGIIGYGVLAATVAAAKPRFGLFNTNFREQMNSKLINRLVRIPRVVVHPEFRGMGVGVLTAKHLVEYAKEYWDINGYTPILVEVIAAMTDYHRFFEDAGFVKGGYTLGSQNGIIPEYGVGEWEQRPNHTKYNFFTDKEPKPYLVFPISKEGRHVLAKAKLIKKQSKFTGRPRPKLTESIKFERLSTAYNASNGLTQRAQEIKRAFSVDSTQMSSQVLKDFTFTINPGDTVLIAGASGSGKSTLIRFLVEDIESLRKHMTITGKTKGIYPNNVAILGTSWNESLPLIDQVGGSTVTAINLLNSVGLAEAHLYLKRPHQISDGQRYRFAVALLCDSGKPVWVADEFTSTLDPLMAAIVAKGIRKLAWKYGATLVLGAPHIENFISSLLPNKVVRLRWGGIADIFSLRCRYNRLEEILRIHIMNTCRNTLTQVVVGGVNKTGRVKRFATIGALSPGERSDPIDLKLDHISCFPELKVTCDQDIGEMMFVRVP